MNEKLLLKDEGYKAVFFDFGNTLIFNNQTFPEAMFKMCTFIGLDITFERLSSVIVMSDTSVLQEEKLGAIKEDDYSDYRIKYYKYLLEMLGYEQISSRYARHFHNTIGYYIKSYLYPEVDYVLSTLKESGYIVGIVSNFSHALPGICDELGLTDKVDFITYSDVVGYEKPLPHIFVNALERANVAPNEAIHVGDFYTADVLGARNVGITPILVSADRDAYNDCIYVENLLEILVLLGIDDGIHYREEAL